MVIAAKPSRICDLHKTRSQQCAMRRRGIVHEQIEVAVRPVGWNRIVGGDFRTFQEHEVTPIRGPDFAEDATRKHPAHCSGAFVRHEIGRNHLAT